MHRGMSRKVAPGLLVVAALIASGGGAKAQDHVVLGAGVAATPAYQGARRQRVLPVPVVDIQQGRFFANLRNGVGATLFESEAVTVGTSLVFVQGYRRRDVPTGIDRLAGGAGARVFASFRAGGTISTLGAVTPISGGSRGAVVDASVAYPMKLSPRFALTPTIGATWADRKYNDRYFGVTPQEAARSGLSQFTASSGVKDLSAALTGSYRFTDQITLSAIGSVSTLLGDIKDSPIVRRNWQPLAILALTYRR